MDKKKNPSHFTWFGVAKNGIIHSLIHTQRIFKAQKKEVDDFYNNSTNKRLTNIFLAQDTGSAINGITRMDLFLGKGKAAEEIAGKLSSRGKIWLFIPK